MASCRPQASPGRWRAPLALAVELIERNRAAGHIRCDSSGRMDAGPVQPGTPDLAGLNVFRSWGLTTTPNECSATTRVRIPNGSRYRREWHFTEGFEQPDGGVEVTL